MNPGILALGLVVAIVAAVGWIAWHRQAIYGGTAHARHLTQAARLTKQIASRPKLVATISAPISAAATPKNDAETVAIMTIAKLIAADLIGETAALQTIFAVKAGSSKRYKEVQAKLKIAQQELDSSIEPAAPTEAGQQR